MMGVHNGVQAHFKKGCSHHSSIHCRNHRLALCFSHLTPWHKPFENFDGLLLNLYLLLKNSSVKTLIFNEIQQSYNQPSLKLIKAATTRRLSHGRAAERILDRYQALVEALETVYGRKQEPAVSGVSKNWLKQRLSPLCCLSDVLECTNSLQVFLQTARLNFLDLPFQVKTVADKLELVKRSIWK